MPWKKATPKLTLGEVAKNFAMMMNAFPPKSTISDYSSPQSIAIGKTLDCEMHFRLPFGDCAQVHQNKEPKNSNKEQTLGAISLGPINDAQGGWKFMSLATSCSLKRHSWDAMPMT